jgi:hypothetical protein
VVLDPWLSVVVVVSERGSMLLSISRTCASPRPASASCRSLCCQMTGPPRAPTRRVSLQPTPCSAASTPSGSIPWTSRRGHRNVLQGSSARRDGATALAELATRRPAFCRDASRVSLSSRLAGLKVRIIGPVVLSQPSATISANIVVKPLGISGCMTAAVDRPLPRPSTPIYPSRPSAQRPNNSTRPLLFPF